MLGRSCNICLPPCGNEQNTVGVKSVEFRQGRGKDGENHLKTLVWAQDMMCDHAYCTPLEIKCTVLHYTALHCITLHCMALHCTALHCTALHCTVLHCTALHCTALHCTALHCITIHYNALHWCAVCTALILPQYLPPLPSSLVFV